MSLRNEQLRSSLKELYGRYTDTLLFHGWHHVDFVARKAVEFADELNVDTELVEAMALVHDLNYIADVTSGVDAGRELRAEYLATVGYSTDEITLIEETVHAASIENRDADISDLAKALSDADSLFKVMPVGPIILSARYITETKVDLRKWADKIMRDQQPLLDKGIYFYTKTANEKYLDWVKVDLALVASIQKSLDDPDIQAFLRGCKELGFI
jgi:uncharacterized protein